MATFILFEAPEAQTCARSGGKEAVDMQTPKGPGPFLHPPLLYLAALLVGMDR